MNVVVLAPHEHLFKLGDVDDSAFYVKTGILDVTAMDYTVRYMVHASIVAIAHIFLA